MAVNGHHQRTNGGEERSSLNKAERGEYGTTATSINGSSTAAAAAATTTTTTTSSRSHKAKASLGGPEKLSERAVWAYAVGHVMNDAAAACWFSYLLVLLEKVRHLSPLNSGIVMFSGQFFDAIATPIVGLLSDATPGIPSLKWSGRKIWYLIGTIIVFFCFLGVFATDPFPGVALMYLCVIYFTVCASLFNVGWAAVQVSHLAMVPELCSNDCERMRLVKLRYAFTILSNLSVFLIYLSRGQQSGHRGTRFKIIAVAVLAVGSLCAAFFLACANAPPARQAALFGGGGGGTRRHRGGKRNKATGAVTKSPAQGQQPPPAVVGAPPQPDNTVVLHQQLSMSKSNGGGGSGYYHHPLVVKWRDWFMVADFYLCAMVYMASRIVVNITQVYCQFFVLDILNRGDLDLALVPLTIYLASLCTTLAMDHVNEALGRKVTLLAGSAVVLVASSGFYILCPATAYLLYPVCAVLGIGSTTIMVTSHSMANDLVDSQDGAAGGFLYGAFSLTDKLANGILILLIQVLKEGACTHEGDVFPPPVQCASLLRNVMSMLPAISAVAACMASHFITTHHHHDSTINTLDGSTSQAAGVAVIKDAETVSTTHSIQDDDDDDEHRRHRQQGGGGECSHLLSGSGGGEGGDFRKLSYNGPRYSSYVEPVDSEVVWSDWVI